MTARETGSVTDLLPATPTGAPVLVVTDLRKSYGDMTALDGVTLTVHEGETIGLVGPNGAGKTTLLECIEGVRRADSGSVTIAGVTASAGASMFHLTFGAQLQESSLPGRLRVGEAMRLFAAFYDDPWDIDDLLDRVELRDRQRTMYRKLSGGQKRRLILALALLGRPPVALLDEPTTGLDPHARLELWGVLERLASGRTAILLATHDMREAQERCDRIYVLDRGRMVANGSVSRLLHEAGLVTKVRVPHQPWVDEVLRAVPGWTASRVVAAAHYAYGNVDFADAAATALRRHLADRSDQHNASGLLAAITTGPADLEDLYLIRTGRHYG
jgi:ABC-2 type transport system ATP-binding protein